MKSADHALFASFYALAAILAGFSTIAFAALASPMLAVSSAILAALLGLSASRELSSFRTARMTETKTPTHQLQFRWRNQRQIRKNRRRAHAAGKKNAFK